MSFWSQFGRGLAWFQAILSQRRYLRLGLLVVLFLAFGVTSFRIIKAQNEQLFAPTSRSDFEDYYQASRLLAEGKDPYRSEQLEDIRQLSGSFNPADLFDPVKLQQIIAKFRGLGTYLYLPFTAFALLPISGLEYHSAAAIFQAASLLSLAIMLWFLYASDRARAQNGWAERDFTVPLVSSLILFAGLLAENAGNGNIGFFLLLLCLPGLVLSMNDSIPRQILGGFLIGIAVVLKITPIFLALVLLAYFRIFALGGLTLGIAFGLIVPGLALGFDRNVELIQGWYALIISTYNKFVFMRPWANNQTISGAIGKLFISGSDVKQASFGLPLLSGVTDFETVRRFGLYVKIANAALMLTALVTSLVVLWRTFAGNFSGMIGEVLGGKKSHVDFWSNVTLVRLAFLVLLVSLVTSGVSWYHAYGMLFLPVYLRIRQSYNGQSLVLLEKIAFTTIGFFSLAPMILSAHMRDTLAMYSIFAFGMVVIALCYAWLILRSSEARNGI
ncbi:MAG: DUF2029 domain-containing protein [Spirochaetia bacterium]|nr:DUF2029 domain-containing protein [Spirochaetia bacterium]